MPSLIADPAQLTQALVNLVINAIQAITGSGYVEVIARAGEQEGMVAIAIRDTGPGVPKEKQAAIFEPFFTTKAEGSGLGLWIVQQVISAHGGFVSVDDGANGGAVFTVQLPLQQKEKVHG
jgi:two-component system sensor histidine kinase HydH